MHSINQLFVTFKYVLSTMGVSKELISKFLIGNRFHVKLRILRPYSFKDSFASESVAIVYLHRFYLNKD